MKFKNDNTFSQTAAWAIFFIPLSFFCLTSAEQASDCVNRSVVDGGSRAMIGLRMCAFLSDFRVTRIYNQMAYDSGKSQLKLVRKKKEN